MALSDELKEHIPDEAGVSKAELEGPKIVLYSDNLEYFGSHPDLIKKLVSTYKKRVDLRADASILVDPEHAKKIIKEMIPEEADITEITFLQGISRVIIEAKKPGLVIGKAGETLRAMKKEIKWSPRVERTPVIPSHIIKTVRHVLYSNVDERHAFLGSIGRKVKPSLMLGNGESGETWVRISALGGAREVGRSAHLLQTPESRILLDCGVNVAMDGAKSFPYLNAPEANIGSIDAVVISHAHLDHSGAVPMLFKYGYKGPVYCTPPTLDLMTLLQLDYVDIAQREGKAIPYTKKEVQETIKHSVTFDYGEVTDITSDVRLTFYNAGHILGSSQCHMHIGDGLHNLIYTGDLKFNRTNLFEGADRRFMRLESLIMESTYGGKNDSQPRRQDGEQRVVEVIEQARREKAKVLMPVLAVGRAQEVMVVIERWARTNNIEDFTVYLDGMIWDATAIHTAYPEYLSRDLRQMIFHEDKNPFVNPVFKRIGSQKEREALIESEEPAMILATSGMLAGGPSVEYFRRFAGNPKNHIIFVSYQGEGTLGKKIQKGLKEVTIENAKGQQERVEVKMAVENIQGFSGHCDRQELMKYVGSLNPKPNKVLVVHGDQAKTLDLASSLHKAYHIDTYAPKNLETVRIF